MSVKTNRATDKKVKDLVAAVQTEEQAKVNLTDEQLLTEIQDRFDTVATKSAMLKSIRLDNFKVSQDRCYNMYLRYQMAVKPETEATTK